MNQILATEKIYVTPGLKRKKKFYKLDFFLSIFLVCILFSYYIYAEYDRNKSEEVSKEILESINLSFNHVSQEDAEAEESEVIRVLLDYSNVRRDEANELLGEESELQGEEQESQEQAQQTTQTQEIPVAAPSTYTENGVQYKAIGVITIPKLGITYPILDKPTDEQMEAMLKASVCKFHGPNANEVGNLCIVGHNYHNSKFFSKISTLKNGDIIEIKDLNGRTLQYKVYDQYIVEPTNVACTSQLTQGKTEITLITCVNNGKQRTVIKAVAAK